MPGTVLLRGGASIFWVSDRGEILDREPIGRDLAETARLIAGGYEGVGAARRRAWGGRPSEAPLVAEPAIAAAVTAAGRPVERASAAALRAARERLPVPPPDDLRALVLAIAEEAARARLAGPDETLIALVREEARLERALGRERSADAQWVPVEGPLAEHAEAARRYAAAFTQHHAELERRVERAALAHVPNLARLVGPKVAGRLVAAAGGRANLARVSGARLQLLGARRRPDPERGPRYGVLFRAPGLEELPDDRRGRYARSLAALAAIAVRADALTGRDLGDRLVLRRDRRLRELRERRR